MTRQPEPDPLDMLRVADPVDIDRLSSASLARIRARVREDVMTTTTGRWRLPSSPGKLGLVGGVVAAGAFAIAALLGSNGEAPGLVPDGAVGPAAAACVEPYSTTAIGNRSFAFDGTVTAIDGEQVTFTVGTAYRGMSDSSITLDAPGMTGTVVTSGGGPNLVVGERYLVAGDDRFVWGCGYTQPYDAAVAAEWAAALGG